MGLAKGEWHDCEPQGLPSTAPASPEKGGEEKYIKNRNMRSV